MGTQMVRGRKNPREHVAYNLQFPVKEDAVPDSRLPFLGKQNIDYKLLLFTSALLIPPVYLGQQAMFLLNYFKTIPDRKPLTNHLVLTASLPGVREGLETTDGV